MNVKRIFDFITSLLGLILLSPVLLIISIAIKIDSRGPIFFRQIRVGQYNKQFLILKFRTMVIDAEKIGAQISSGNDPRITMVGRFLRKYKLDEFPQLINVAKGEMSIVGPRPEVPHFVAAYECDYREILKMKPGITDYASIEYKDENELLSVEDDPERKYIEEIMPIKISYYYRYLEEQSFKTDMILILKTIIKIIGL
ncbi:hypothetical protein BIU88_00490 [Chlorobaculum limnaeum]|uniref:Bacterial sugar transferase domain-containing protein n=1 Tax=Chlorobaculum limnaeum TaxID=274537 RepID=A0A1D8D5T3_CHLLM|nr:sugar transferase [Chlorobaculum limnaeum]AOS82759.1 hypothetical protein BIU88_00490 [Chlorobaculum limnaeum]